jgi:xylulokinase
VLAVGGGTKNQLWLQATSDITGLPQIVSQNSTGASYGNAFLAALAIGAAQPGDIAQWNPAAESITATPHPAYARNYHLFRLLYEQTKDIARALSSAD